MQAQYVEKIAGVRAQMARREQEEARRRDLRQAKISSLQAAAAVRTLFLKPFARLLPSPGLTSPAVQAEAPAQPAQQPDANHAQVRTACSDFVCPGACRNDLAGWWIAAGAPGAHHGPGRVSVAVDQAPCGEAAGPQQQRQQQQQRRGSLQRIDVQVHHYSSAAAFSPSDHGL